MSLEVEVKRMIPLILLIFTLACGADDWANDQWNSLTDDCRPIGEYPVADLKSVATSGSHIHLRYVDKDKEWNTYLPAREASGGRFRINQPLREAFVREYAECSDEEVYRRVIDEMEHRREGGVQTGFIDWRSSTAVQPVRVDPPGH